MKQNKPLQVPSTQTILLVFAGILLLVPIVALLWVKGYARVEPTLLGFPFFIWYQFLWVILCSLYTLAAHACVRRARPRKRK
ncbi:MAG: DUF3311 domain-containing protein [Pseudomonadales bacterium]|jgi:membrane protein implicated in regulation of membrane protease activity|nr:DUF3311 domain-containing protein [Pseudomonadales bacterium]